jgi:TolB-like protein
MFSGAFIRLRERGVLRVAASYAVIAWLVLQIADVALEPWNVPDWVRRAPLVIALLGFPVALALAWFLELGDSGVIRDTELPGAVRPVTHGARRYADVAVISVLAAVVGFFLLRDAGWLGDTMRPDPGVESSSLAVLPFVNVGSAQQAYLSEGLSDELRDQFSRMQSLSVTARSSSTAFTGQSLDAVTIAEKLAVAALLEGTVGQESGRVRVAVQLVNGRTGKVLWAERYDRPDQDLLAVQAEVAQAVVAAVLPRFSAAGKKAPPPPTSDPVAYDLYLLGRQKLREIFYVSSDTPGRDAFAEKAEALFRSAIDADPEFAQAYAGLARALHAQTTNKAETVAAERAITEIVERALELDPKLSEAYLVKGLVLRDTDRPGMGEYLRRAVELDPSNTVALLALSQSLRTEGRFDESYRMILRARDLDPMDHSSHYRAVHGAAFLGHREEVLAVVERMQTQFPADPDAATLTCQSWFLLGDYDEAAACLIRTMSEHAGNAPLVMDLSGWAGGAFMHIGEDALALRYYEQAGQELLVMHLRRDRPAMQHLARESLARDLYFTDCEIAEFLALGGMPEEALAIYRRCGMADITKTETGGVAFFMGGLAQMIALLQMQGDVEKAKQLLPELTKFTEKMTAHGADGSTWRYLHAQQLALVGRSDAALDRLGVAVDSLGMPWPVSFVEDDPVFRELRTDPRFKAHVQRMRVRQAEIRARLPKTFRRYGLAWPPVPATP